ncbi:MAG: hypothetical protein HY038_08990 [Nitrospirae bacterium]|nr:hypothetical protein [Nitrospirota bacterium]
MHRLAAIIGLLSCVLMHSLVQAEDTAPTQPHSTVMPTNETSCRLPGGVEFENIQIETADIRLHEQLFEQVLHASVIQRLDHPLTDHIRIYCYRGVAVVIRHDLRTPRPTGWVQINFMVKDAAAVQQELDSAYRASPLSQLSESERAKIVRFRMKTGVIRGDRKVDRLEVYGPEGFLIGFDQPQQ